MPRAINMTNPWLKKNPLMSMWLSGANKVVGSARGQATSAVKRQAKQANAAVSAAVAEQAVAFWTGTLTAPSARPRKRTAKR